MPESRTAEDARFLARERIVDALLRALAIRDAQET
jgi:hypothetical protein